MAKKKPTFTRTTISLPRDLQRKMQKCDGVNWSSIAATAFAAEVAKINCQKQEKPKMDDVIERLRASDRENRNVLFEEGREFGEEWAKTIAEATQLRALQRAWDSPEISIRGAERWLDWGDGCPPPSSQFFGFIENVSGDSEPDFWELALGDDNARLADESEFVHGFAAGISAFGGKSKNVFKAEPTARCPRPGIFKDGRTMHAQQRLPPDCNASV